MDHSRLFTECAEAASGKLLRLLFDQLCNIVGRVRQTQDPDEQLNLSRNKRNIVSYAFGAPFAAIYFLPSFSTSAVMRFETGSNGVNLCVIQPPYNEGNELL